MGNPVVHFEILGPDGAELIDYYRELFGWPMRPGQLPGWPHYGHFQAEHGIAGAVGTAQILQGEPRVVVCVQVDDPQAYLDGAEQLGGQPILPVTEIPQAQITVAWMRYPQGNIIGLVKPD